eukprot:5221278-Amphidinium_carterae.1
MQFAKARDPNDQLAEAKLYPPLTSCHQWHSCNDYGQAKVSCNTACLIGNSVTALKVGPQASFQLLVLLAKKHLERLIRLCSSWSRNPPDTRMARVFERLCVLTSVCFN